MSGNGYGGNGTIGGKAGSLVAVVIGLLLLLLSNMLMAATPRTVKLLYGKPEESLRAVARIGSNWRTRTRTEELLGTPGSRAVRYWFGRIRSATFLLDEKGNVKELYIAEDLIPSVSEPNNEHFCADLTPDIVADVFPKILPASTDGELAKKIKGYSRINWLPTYPLFVLPVGSAGFQTMGFGKRCQIHVWDTASHPRQ